MKWLKVMVVVLFLAGVASAQTMWHEWATDSPNDSVYADSTGYDQYVRDIIVAGCDLDQDGKPEVIFTDYKNGGRLHVFEEVAPETLQEVWVYQFPNSGYYSTVRSVKVGDLDGDGNGEILVAYTGPSGDTTYAGLYVFEWNGSDNGYGNPNGTPSARIIDFAFEYDSTGALVYPDKYRSEDIAVGDFDGDGVSEVLWVNNASTPFDNAYIFSIIGDVSGFYVTQPETTIRRTVEGFGGSTASGYGPVDLDGDGHPEGIVTIWNYMGLAVVEGVAANQYQVTYHVEGLAPADRYPYGKALGTVDVDGDGKSDLIMGGLLRSYSYVIRSTDDNTFVVDTVDFGGVDSTLTIYALRAGDIDGDGHADLYITSYGEGLVDYAFSGAGAISDPANWTKEIIWDNFRSDTIIVDTTDSSGAPIQDTLWVKTNVGPSLALADIDGDGYGEAVFVTHEEHNVAAIPYNTGFLHVVEYGPSGVEEWTVLPPKGTTVELYAPAPNPFRNSAQLSFYVPSRSNVTLNIYDATGRLVRTLVNGNVDAGRHTVTWDGTDNSGRSVSEGVYIYRLTANGESLSKRIVLLK